MGPRCLIVSVLVLGLVSTVFSQTAPAWVTSPPDVEGDSTVFVASGSDPNGDAGAAEKAALQSLKDEITSYLGVKVTKTTSATMRGSADAYQAQVEQSIVSSSKNQIAGLRLADRFLLKSPPSVTVYLKALYNQADLEAEKGRIRKLFQEVADSTAQPEAEGDRLAAAGQVFSALQEYLIAAAAALNPEVDNRDIKFERNLTKARALVPKLSLTPVGGAQKTLVGQPFAKTFDVLVTQGTGPSAVPQAGVPLRFAIKVKKNNRTTVVGFSVKTDDQGLARFSFPAPDAVIKDSIQVSLDLAASFEPFLSASSRQQSLVSGVEDLVSAARLALPYQVESAGKTVPLELNVTALGKNQGPWAGNEAAVALKDALVRAGFKVAKTTPPRLVLAHAEVLETVENDGLVTCRVQGTVKVVLRSDETSLLSQPVLALGSGKDEKAATVAAFSQWGVQAATLLINGLP